MAHVCQLRPRRTRCQRDPAPARLHERTQALPQSLGIEMRFYRVRRENNFQIDLDRDRAPPQIPRTKLILVNSPAQPTRVVNYETPHPVLFSTSRAGIPKLSLTEVASSIDTGRFHKETHVTYALSTSWFPPFASVVGVAILTASLAQAQTTPPDVVAQIRAEGGER